MSVLTEGLGGGRDDPDDRRDDVIRKVTEHAIVQGRKRKRAKVTAAQQPPAKRQRQAKITNYFGRRGQDRPAPTDHQFVTDEEVIASVPITVPDNIEVDGEDGEFRAKDTDTNEDVGSLTLYWDDADEIYWVNHVEVEEEYRGRGIARAMLNRACAENGTIYFSLQTADEDEGGDTRHLTSDGYGLATAACRDPRLRCEMALPGDVFVRDDEDEPENAEQGEPENAAETQRHDEDATEEDESD